MLRGRLRLAPLFSLLLTASVSGGAAGCATGDGMQNKLQEASRGYNRNLRWGDFDRAAEYLPASSRSLFMAHHEEISDRLVIVDYQVTRLELNKEKGTAASRAEIVWHTDDMLIVQTTRVDQVWQWHEGNWVLVDEHRSGGKPLSVFAEPEDEHPWLPGLEMYREVYEIGEENRHKGKKKGRKKGKSKPPSDAPKAASPADAPTPDDSTPAG